MIYCFINLLTYCACLRYNQNMVNLSEHRDNSVGIKLRQADDKDKDEPLIEVRLCYFIYINFLKLYTFGNIISETFP